MLPQRNNKNFYK